MASSSRVDERRSDVVIPGGLTVVEEKRSQYALDTYFREAWWDLAPLHDSLSRLAVVVFKPDAVVGRRIGSCLDLLARHGFTSVAVASFQYDRHSIRDTWRYQFNIASADRIEVVDLLLTMTPSLLVVLSDEDAAADLPASVRLGSIKGPSEPSLRQAGDLRHELGVLTTLFNFIHTSDEPIDVPRELGVALDRRARQDIVRQIARREDVVARVRDQAAQLEARHPARDLDLEATLERLAAHPLGEVNTAARQVAGGERAAWRPIFSAVPEVDAWDALTVATACIECNVPDVTALLPSVAGAPWIDLWRGRSPAAR